MLETLAGAAFAPAILWKGPTRNRRMAVAITKSNPFRLQLTTFGQVGHLTIAPVEGGVLHVQPSTGYDWIPHEARVRVELVSLSRRDARDAAMVQYDADDDPYGVPGIIFVRGTDGRFRLVGFRWEGKEEKEEGDAHSREFEESDPETELV